MTPFNDKSTVNCASVFDADYFIRGEATGKSNFTDYHWMPDRTISMVTHLKRHLGLRDKDFVLDYGCGPGNYVRALRMIGLIAFGFDISTWAVENADPIVRHYLSNHLRFQPLSYDLVFSKDCLEHLTEAELNTTIPTLCEMARKKLFFIVPLAKERDGPYVHPKEEKDSTHVIRWTLHDWLVFFQSCSGAFVVNGSYGYPGLKPGTYEVENGYGFISMDRI